MKRLLCFLIFIFALNHFFAQTENYTRTINNFQKQFNTADYNKIFESFSLEMKQALPINENKEFLADLKSQMGAIKSVEFKEYQQSTYAVYKTQFEKGVLAVNISLDAQNKINGLLINPYKDPSKVVNALASYPKEIAELIYSTTRQFPEETQLSIAVTQNGKTQYYGVLKHNDSVKSVQNQNKAFEIGSITKVFTSTVLASLVESKKIKLTDLINSYYSFSFKDHKNINFEELANHTSGLPRLPENLDVSNEINPYKNYHTKELEDYLKNLMKLASTTSKSFSYSNLGAGLLGYTLGLSQKTTFQKLLQKTVFDQYGMTHSFTSTENLGNTLVKGHNATGETVSNWDWDVLFGGGGIVSTTEDLVKFANAQFDPANKELALTRKPTFTVDKTTKIGLGWHIISTKNNKEIFYHNGGTGGYSSSMTMDMENKTAVIILSNVSGINDSVDRLCFKLLGQADKK
ncbi:serine hydrolase [Chryseobacterium lactis]|uniref:serine hydrolase n=1 Tax=Chryseobacterium lactis TaxID=1241981 RepID=UPI00162652A1|nr:serine hydrolase [Chryseobacterium lactis]